MDPSIGRWNDEVVAAHRALVTHVEAMAAAGDDDPAAPSLLPGWSRGHVLTHIARNADGLARILAGVDAGETWAQYAGGVEQRNGDIEAGATRPWAELVDDVRSACEGFERQLAGQRRWDGSGIGGTGKELQARDVPFHRLREVVVHHADLGDDGYTFADWPAVYVREDLRRQTMVWDARRPMGTTGLPAQALAVPEVRRLAWLLGRADVDGLDPAGQRF